MIPRFQEGQPVLYMSGIQGSSPSEGRVLGVRLRVGYPASIFVRFLDGGPPVPYDEDDERLYPLPMPDLPSANQKGGPP